MWGHTGRRQALISPALLSQLRQVTLWQGGLAAPAQAAATAPSLASSATACPPPPLPPGGGTAWPQRSTMQWRSFAALPSTAGGEPQTASPIAAAAAEGDKPWRKPGRWPRDGAFLPPLAAVAKGDLQVIAAAASGTPPICDLLSSGRQSARNEHQALVLNPCPVCPSTHPLLQAARSNGGSWRLCCGSAPAFTCTMPLWPRCQTAGCSRCWRCC